jgi:hypothetical protein
LDSSVLSNVVLPHADALDCVRFTLPLAQFAGVCDTTHLLNDVQPVPLALVHATPPTASGTDKHAEQLAAPAEEYVQFAHVPQLVAVPPALYVPAAHCVQVFWDFKIIGPATNLPVPELIKNLLLTVSYIPNTPSLSRFAGIRLTFVPSVSIIKL